MTSHLPRRRAFARALLVWLSVPAFLLAAGSGQPEIPTTPAGTATIHRGTAFATNGRLHEAALTLFRP